MKTERVEKEVVKKEYDIKYIADDGTAFDDEYDCYIYEVENHAKTLGVKIKDGSEFYEGCAGKIYYIPTEEAYEYIRKNIWWNNFCYWDYGKKEYRGPGWYLRIIHEEQYTS